MEPASCAMSSSCGGPSGVLKPARFSFRVVPGVTNSSPNLSVPPELAVPTISITRIDCSELKYGPVTVGGDRLRGRLVGSITTGAGRLAGARGAGEHRRVADRVDRRQSEQVGDRAADGNRLADVVRGPVGDRADRRRRSPRRSQGCRPGRRSASRRRYRPISDQGRRSPRRPAGCRRPITVPVISTLSPSNGLVSPVPWIASIAVGAGGAAHAAPHGVPSASPLGPEKSAALLSVSCKPVPLTAGLRVKTKSDPVAGKVRPVPSAHSVPGSARRCPAPRRHRSAAESRRFR